jgi:hypothetical protein
MIFRQLHLAHKPMIRLIQHLQTHFLLMPLTHLYNKQVPLVIIRLLIFQIPPHTGIKLIHTDDGIWLGEELL